MVLPQFYVDDVIRTALKEDINYLDTTTDLMIPEEARTTARFMAKAEGVVCGLEIALRVFTLLDNTFSARVLVKDGDTVRPGELLAELEGRTRFLLKGERTALNLLQHLSGVATATRPGGGHREGHRRLHCRYTKDPARPAGHAEVCRYCGRWAQPPVQLVGRRHA